ncbi:unnamed protein product [Rotaria socialis]|uniref:Amine oxidase n=1 Tax=Rotaria socialis TaxID=392032 RepID=A0A820VXN7_9BILA|nr:unnamed protein product [Rotaria socialis]CAF4508898.1 unnamed protein product [Rotaria socialis]
MILSNMFIWLLTLFVFQIASRPSHSARLRFHGDNNGPPPLDLDPNNMYNEQMLNTAQQGLPKCLTPRNVAVIGGGVAGLITSLELSLSGHMVQLFEASNRLGGRIYTYRAPKGYITELGAMRLPLDQHLLLATYIKSRFGLPIKQFQHYNPNTVVYLNGITAQRSSPHLFPETFNFNVSDKEKGQTPWVLWDTAIKPLLDMDDATQLRLYGAYSVQFYLMEVANLSRGAVDFIGLMLNLEADMYASIVEIARDFKLLPVNANFSHIDGGNDLLINALAKACQTVLNGRCSLYLNRPISSVLYSSSSHTGTLESKGLTVPGNFTDIVVATTARAANAIDFRPRIEFITKYQALRQLNYDCASKIAHSFSVRWWEKQVITGGHSITDLPVRFVYYYNFNTTSNRTEDGAIMLSSYTWAQDALLWSGMRDNQSCRLALDNLNLIHATSDVYSYEAGCQTYHWCNDPYSLGAYALFTPYQEVNIHNDLGASVGDTVHFIGEHTSLAHAWVEGAVLSSMRLLMHLQEEVFDLAIIGGGPLGLATALAMSQKQPTWRIAIIERFQLGNTQGSSGSSDIRQFQQAYVEWYMSDLGRLAVPMWQDLERRASLPPAVS